MKKTRSNIRDDSDQEFIMELKRKNDTDSLYLEKCHAADGSEVPLLKYPLLEKTGMVEHCFSTRMGGVSEGIFSSMNLSFTRGDDREAVETNFHRIAEAMGVPFEKMVFTDQTHTTCVRKVTGADAGKGLLRERDYRDVDGLITDEAGLVLCAFFADCVPLYFVDPVHRAIGLSHSGWRGTVKRMGEKTVQALKDAYGTRPEDLICAIGPSICVDCYEVSQDTINEFRKNYSQSECELIIQPENKPGKYLLNLPGADYINLINAGVRPENIYLSDVCTSENSDILFSHRASSGKRGIMCNFIKIIN